VSGETAQTLDRGLIVLELVAASSGGLTVAELAEQLGVGRTVVYRLVSTLAAHGLVRRDPEGRVRLGPGALRLAGRVQPAIRSAAMPVLRRLAEQCGATAHLTVAEGDEAVALAVVEPTWTDYHVAYRVGSRHPLGAGAAGRALLAGRSGSAAAVASSGELQPGAYGVAAAVLGAAGLEASVGVVSMEPLDLGEAGPRVEAAARAVGAALAG